MSALRPGAGVRPVTNGAVLARAGRTVVVDGSAAMEAAARILSASPAALAKAPEPVRELLRREGLSIERNVTAVDRPVAARAADDSWAAVSGARWRISGPGAFVAAAQRALRCWLPDAEVSVSVSSSGVGAEASLDIAVIGDGAGAAVTVAPDGDGCAVLHTTAVPRWRAWRERVPAAGAAEFYAHPLRSLDITIAVGSAFVKVHEQLAGVDDAASWTRVSQGTSRLRSLPPLAPSIRRVEVTAIADSRPAPDENGEVIDALTAGADDEFGWWTPPHPGELTQLPLAFAESWLRIGPRTGRAPAAGAGAGTDDALRVIGAADTHDGAWVETALGVARIVAGGAAGFGTIAACADLAQAFGGEKNRTTSRRMSEAAATHTQFTELGLTPDSVHRSLQDPHAALAEHTDLVAGVENGDDRAADLLVQAIAYDGAVAVESVSLGQEWDAAGVVAFRVVERAGGDRRGSSEADRVQYPHPHRPSQPEPTERSAGR